ncbi:EXP1-like protein [Schizophyllum fasciatum]
MPSATYHRVDPSSPPLSPMSYIHDPNQHPVSFGDATDQMIFGDLDFDDAMASSSVSFPWDPPPEFDFDVKPPSQMHPFDMYPSMHQQHPSPMYAPDESKFSLSNWINDTDVLGPSSPIPIPSSVSSLSPYSPFNTSQPLPQDGFSPTEFAAMQPLPMSPSSYEEADPYQHQHQARMEGVHHIDSISPGDTTFATPAWANDLWHPGTHAPSPAPSRTHVRHTSLMAAQRPRLHSRHDSLSSPHSFQSSSAPSMTQRAPSSSRPYSRRSESVSQDDPDATVRRRKRAAPSESSQAESGAPTKSELRPPKLAPSAWQLYFTDWIQKQQASSTRKLNVAQAAKEAGQDYAALSAAEKEPYKARSEALKAQREKELDSYLRKLTPDDIKRENAFRTAQRKAGKSRKGNLRDPNAPKKPLSAYFMFLSHIRSNPHLVKEIFGDEQETTRQSSLAAQYWREMTDEGRRPFLAQAEKDKLEYEAARRLYEEGTTTPGTNINFSILQQSPTFGALRIESESESEGARYDGGRRKRDN